MMKRFSMVMAALLFATPAFAQLPGINVHLGARAGVFTPLGALAEIGTVESKLKSGLAIGASLELDIPLSPINVRANLDAAMGAKIQNNGVDTNGEVDIVAITGDLVFRPIPRVFLQPYLLAGAGIKRYSFENVNGAEDDSDFTGHIGAGADLKVGPLSVFGEVSDYISSFKFNENADGKLQNDVFVMVGFRIGML
jgi:hypothetical protein